MAKVIKEETVCHCNLEENARLIAQILDADEQGIAFGGCENEAPAYYASVAECALMDIARMAKMCEDHPEFTWAEKEKILLAAVKDLLDSCGVKVVYPVCEDL